MIPTAGLELGIVVAVYPQGQSIDVLLPDSGSRLTNVQVMVPTGSNSTGMVDLPDPGLPQDDTRWNITNDPKRNIRAVLGSYQGNPICLGFLLPQLGQMTFAESNRRITRHASDVYSTVDQFGNIELFHPSGTFIRIASNPAHEDLTSQDFDGEWSIANNTATAPYLNVTIANSGTVKATFQVDPAGNVSLTAPTLNVVAEGGITMNGATIDKSGNLGVPGTATIAGEATVAGTLNANSTLMVAGVTTGGGVNLDSHVHAGIQRGTESSDPPTPE
jgi:hypothetical protein